MSKLKINYMKKTFLLSAIAFFLSFSLQAQIKKGSTMLGFDFNFNGANSKYQAGTIETKTSSNSFGISLLAGKAIKENLFAGAGASYGTYKSNQGTSEQTSKNYGGSIWLRRYFPVAKAFYIFANGSLGTTFGKTENNTANTAKNSSFGLSINLTPGISYQVKKSFYLDAAIGNIANIYYSHAKSEQTDSFGNTTKQTGSNYGFSTSLGNDQNPLQIGLRWIIPAKG